VKRESAYIGVFRGNRGHSSHRESYVCSLSVMSISTSMENRLVNAGA
jgi:hypothetical protein